MFIRVELKVKSTGHSGQELGGSSEIQSKPHDYRQPTGTSKALLGPGTPGSPWWYPNHPQQTWVSPSNSSLQHLLISVIVLITIMNGPILFLFQHINAQDRKLSQNQKSQTHSLYTFFRNCERKWRLLQAVVPGG